MGNRRFPTKAECRERASNLTAEGYSLERDLVPGRFLVTPPGDKPHPPYEVNTLINRSSGEITCDCSCPFYRAREYCKHAEWVLILLASAVPFVAHAYHRVPKIAWLERKGCSHE
jgi:hypothetical protein